MTKSISEMSMVELTDWCSENPDIEDMSVHDIKEAIKGLKWDIEGIRENPSLSFDPELDIMDCEEWIAEYEAELARRKK